MDTQDPALQPETLDESNAPIPPEADNQVESEEPEGSEDREQKPQDDQENPVEPEAEHEIIIEGEKSQPERDAAPNWVKDLRREHRELKARNVELERALKSQTQPEQELGQKPTLDSCDYDTEAFEQSLEAWHLRKQEVSRRESYAQAEIENQRRAWNEKLQAYARAREGMAKQIPSFSEAEANAQSMLDVTQQGVIVSAADSPAMVICALGQNPNLAQDLANEKDPIKFAFKVAKLEAKLKMAKKNNAPPPEKPVKGTGGTSGSVDSQLERLRADADKTGDYTKVIAYKRRKQQK